MYDSTIMWNSFWRSRDRFSLDQLRYLTDQLIKVQVVNEVNKDFVIEALRSIAELMTYGDQHDPSYFEYFMEKQVMGEFVRILKLSKTVSVPLQLLQTVSILVQNLRNEHAICRAISGKLNKNTVSLLVKIRGDEVVSFPLYVEAIRFAFHEENMVRTAVRAVTLNVYHVGDDSVNRYISSVPHKDYFSNLISFFRKQSMDLNKLVSHTLINPGPNSTSTILAAIDEIEDNLYYFSDIVSAGIPDVGRLITDSILTVLVFPLLLPSLRIAIDNDVQSGVVTSLYLLCCILRIIKIKDLANTIAAALSYPSEAFTKCSGGKFNSHISDHGFPSEYLVSNNHNLTKSDIRHSMFNVPHSSSSSGFHPEGVLMQNDCSNSNLSLRDVLLAYVTKGDDIQVLGSLSVLVTLLQTKELDESMLDELGILPQRKQHKKLLLQALVGESSGEEELFSSKSSLTRHSTGSDIDAYHEKIKDRYGISCQSSIVGNSPHVNRFQVIDALVSLFCRSNISAETLWEGGWLLRRLLPYSESEFNSHHLELLKVSYDNCAAALVEEVKGIWTDFLISVLCDEWRKCKRAMESSSPPKEPNCVLLLPHPHYKFSLEDNTPKGSSFAAGERMQELVKVFVLLHQLQLFTLGRALPDQPPIDPTGDLPTNCRAQTSGLDVSGPKAGTEINL
ncbi:hypothetical protein TSUD_205440, partial [Trifolium subterraneum]